MRSTILALILGACAPAVDSDPIEGVDTGADADTDPDTAVDTGEDPDTDTEPDTDVDTEPDTDTDVDTEPDTDTDADTEPDTDTDADTEDPLRDSDGDGWTDAEELAAYTDPADATDHPYVGGWPIGACRSTIVSTGTAVGDVAPNFALVDQHGDTVRLHDLCAQAVLVDFGVMWCPGCQAAATTQEGRWNRYRARGFIAVTAHSEDATGAAPTVGDLAAWEAYFGTSFPILADPGGLVDLVYDPSQTSRPTYLLLAPGAVIAHVGNNPSDAAIEAILPITRP